MVVMEHIRKPACKLTREDRRIRYLEQRQRRLPEIIEATRHKLRALEVEAKRYGMEDLLD